MSNYGLVLEGGAMRGLYTAGVIDVMLENKIEFSTIVGVSAGACFGCNYKSQQIGRVYNYNLEFCNDQRYMGMKSFLKTGDYFNTDFAYNKVPYELHPFDLKTYQNHPSKFYVVATEVNSAKAHYQEIKKGDLSEIDWIRASASMPVISRPVTINNHRYLDGGISDPIPIKWIEANATSKNIVILTQTKDYRKAKVNEKITNLVLKKYPKIAKAMIERDQVYNETLDYIDKKTLSGETFVIQPSQDLQIKRIEKNKDKLSAMYNLGRTDMENKLEALKKFMELD